MACAAAPVPYAEGRERKPALSETERNDKGGRWGDFIAAPIGSRRGIDATFLIWVSADRPLARGTVFQERDADRCWTF